MYDTMGDGVRSICTDLRFVHTDVRFYMYGCTVLYVRMYGCMCADVGPYK